MASQAAPTAYAVYATADTTHRAWQQTRSAAVRQARLRGLAALTVTFAFTTALLAALTIGALT